MGKSARGVPNAGNTVKFSIGDSLAAERERFETLYDALNRKGYIHPDPLELVHRFDNPADQEVAGLVASALAYGRVESILGSLDRVFTALPDPARMLATMSRRELSSAYRGFFHRWTRGEDLAALLWGIRTIRQEFGSLEACFAQGLRSEDETVVPALAYFVGRISSASGLGGSSLVPCPTRGSACKRLFLFLRWMVRRDEVDPGPWVSVPPSQLVVPLDTHMHRVALRLRATRRRQADLRCALEVTGYFRRIAPDDPVRYDFALTRAGIRADGVTRDVTEAFLAC